MEANKNEANQNMEAGASLKQIQNVIINKIAQRKRLHKREIKGIIDEIKNYYLLNKKINIEELRMVTEHLKSHWAELKEQAKFIRRQRVGFG